MKPICLMAVGSVDDEVIGVLEQDLERAFALPMTRMPALPEPAYAWDPVRKQYSSSLILARLLDAKPAGAARLLALTCSDLFIPMLSFIYGQAQLDGSVSIVSLARLRPEFYGFGPNPALLMERARKEAMHELGHTFGLTHCPDRACVMALATNIQQLDSKRGQFCGGCASLVRHGVRRAVPRDMEEGQA